MSIPRGKYIGKRVDGQMRTEADCFLKCSDCGGWIDLRDLGAVFAHERPLPHPQEDQPQ